jgi:hypothetical protein
MPTELIAEPAGRATGKGASGPPLEVHDHATLNPSDGQIVGMFSAIFF